MENFEDVWNRIQKFQGETFITKTGKAYTYCIQGNNLVPSRTDYNISKENIKKAFLRLPLNGPGDISGEVVGSSYVWGILSDRRILK